MNIHDLFPEIVFETTTIEFKQFLNEKSPLPWLKTVDTFANTAGGQLYIGVKDDGALSGFPHDLVDGIVLSFQRIVKEHFKAPLAFSFTYPSYREDGEERYLVVVSVPRSPMRPLILSYEGNSLVFVRHEAKNSAATYELIREMIVSSEYIPYDSQDTGVPFDPARFSRLDSRYREARGKPLTEKVLQSWGFLSPKRTLTRGGALFADDCRDPITTVRACEWAGLDKTGDFLIEPTSFEGPLFDVVDFIVSYIEKRTIALYEKRPSGAKESRPYPARSVFEAAVNAIAHRNYYEFGQEILVDLFPNRLEILSPGSLPSGELLTHELNLSRINVTHRNPVISRVFVGLQMMECEGSGFEKILDEYRGAGETLAPFLDATGSYVRITLPNPRTPGIEDAPSPEITHLLIEGEKPMDAKILSLCYYAPRSMEEIAVHVDRSVSTKFRKDVIGRLVDQGFLLLKKEGKRNLYRANPAKVFPLGPKES